MTYPIETDVPIPPTGSRKGFSKYPFASLAVGHSFFVAGGIPKNMSVAAHRHGRALGRQFVVRKTDGGIRVWRVK